MTDNRMEVNLFDSLFGEDGYSTAWKESEHIRYVRTRREYGGVTIFTDAQVNQPIVDEVHSANKVAWLREPACLHPETYAQIVDNAHKFDKVLTYYQPLLDRGENYSFVPYGGIWIPQKIWSMKTKSRMVSMLYGHKQSTAGHLLRREISARIPAHWGVDFYGHRGMPVGYGSQTKYAVLGDYRFSIVTETCRDPNLFTEWLLDCFVVGTIPIFWGCPNLDKFFDTRGVLQFETVDECIAHLEFVLKEGKKFYISTYEARLNNMRLAAQYEIAEDWIWENLLK